MSEGEHAQRNGGDSASAQLKCEMAAGMREAPCSAALGKFGGKYRASPHSPLSRTSGVDYLTTKLNPQIFPKYQIQTSGNLGPQGKLN